MNHFYDFMVLFCIFWTLTDRVDINGCCIDKICMMIFLSLLVRKAEKTQRHYAGG